MPFTISEERHESVPEGTGLGNGGSQMGIILYSTDFGRRAEYLTSVLMSPYAITIPITGHDDRVESDFLCVGLEETAIGDGNSLRPNLRLLFWVQTKSQSAESPQKIEIDSRSKVESILNNKMPYFIAIVNPKLSPPKLSLYATSERLAFKHLYPNLNPVKIHFVPGFPVNSDRMYSFEESSGIAIIHMGEPFLNFGGTDSLDRQDTRWMILKKQIEMDYSNFIYATAGLGYYKRSKRNQPETEEKIFFPENGKLTSTTLHSISLSLQMLNLTLIEHERNKHPEGDVAKSMDTLLEFLEVLPPASPSPEIPNE